MLSSTGAYYPRLDHVRAVAAFLVFYWHFVHVGVPTSAVPPFFAFSVLEEGWTGVALFMTLSGYLFAKITEGRTIDYASFLYNRLVRLGPLLVLAFAYYLAAGVATPANLLAGLYNPRLWPGVTWSLCVEMHFYLLFPALVVLQRRYGAAGLISLLAVAVSLRLALWLHLGEVQSLAYWTIVGNVDLFLAGMLCARLRGQFLDRYAGWLFLGALLSFMLFWHYFNSAGGYYHLGGRQPSPSALWIVLPTIQALAWGSLIATYERAGFSLPPLADRWLGRIGEASYSIYIWHGILLFAVIKANVVQFPTSLGAASLAAVVAFVPMVGVALLSYQLIERPFLRFRIRYLDKPHASALRP